MQNLMNFAMSRAFLYLVLLKLYENYEIQISIYFYNLNVKHFFLNINFTEKLDTPKTGVFV